MTRQNQEQLNLRVNLTEYPATRALRSYQIQSELVRFDFCGPKVAHNGFKDMVRESRYDAGELAIATFLQARAYGKPYVLLPAPISGRLQHHCIGYNSEFGILSPKDIEGKRVGVRSYAQTTGLWVRAILQHDFGVDLDRVTWCTVDDAHLAEHRDPANCERLPAGSKLDELMMSGDLAAAILGDLLPADPRVARLIPDHEAAAQDWYRRYGFMPLNHVFVIHERFTRENPDIVREIFRMIVASREEAPEAVRLRLPPFGLTALRQGLEHAIEWSLEQKIIPRRLSVDELFDEVTHDLMA